MNPGLDNTEGFDTPEEAVVAAAVRTIVKFFLKKSPRAFARGDPTFKLDGMKIRRGGVEDLSMMLRILEGAAADLRTRGFLVEIGSSSLSVRRP